MYKSFTILLVLLCIHAMSYSQDISGEWHGNFKSFLYSSTDDLQVDIEIYNDSLIRGHSYLKYGGNRHEHYIINGVYYKADSTVIFTESEEVSINLGMLGENVPGTYTMKLSVEDSIMRLEGKWRQVSGSGFNIMNSKVWLEKKIPYTRPQKMEEPITEDVSEQLMRNTEVQRVIELEEEEFNNITIEIVDNAKVDGDIISVFINDELVVNKQTISETPIRHTFTLPQGSSVLKMSAISTGSMPPCTARMTIITSKNRHVFELSGNSTRNAAVEFKLK